jgi:hypothetical protein
MAHDVFISHSHSDKPAADAACAALEARGIRCWIAPRDIDPGRDWAASIVEAIRDAQIMLLVFSRHANHSPQVKREVERAANSGKVLLPLRIDDVLPEAALEYYLSTPHWLDAITPPLEAHLEKLADACSSLLKVTGQSPQHAIQDPSPVVARAAAQPSAGKTGDVKSSGSPRLWWGRQRRQVQLGMIAAIVVILVVGGYLLAGRKSQPLSTSQPTAGSQLTTTTPTGHPLVADAALEGLLLSPDQIKTAVGATGMTVAGSTAALADSAANIADKACLPMQGPGEATAYAGSGWSAARGQALREPGDTWTHGVSQYVVLFSSAHDAEAFFTASAQRWPACANRQYTVTLPGQPDHVVIVGPVSNTNSTLGATQTFTANNGLGTCQRALTVADNVAIDVQTCFSNQAARPDSAIDVAHQIAAKVPT